MSSRSAHAPRHNTLAPPPHLVYLLWRPCGLNIWPAAHDEEKPHMPRFDLKLHLMNPQQREATQHIDGPLLILAGAGSGKTRVITHRIGYLIEQGVDPSHILAVSFTNKAADEMAERVAHLIGQKAADEVHMSTFHSLGADILRKEMHMLGYRRPLNILDDSDQIAIIKDILKELRLDPKIVEPPRLLALLSRAKMEMVEPAKLPGFKYDPLIPFAQRAWSHYQATLKGRNAVDFDDLISLPVQLFQQHEEARLRWSTRFKYVMIDEYQDTNQTQLEFMNALVRDHHNICVVGDDDQSIYGFRGAVSDNILMFENQFPGTKIIKLEQNYRSTGKILEAANKLIAHNRARKAKQLWSANGEGEQLAWVQCDDERQEAEFVVAELIRWRTEYAWRWSDLAILYRANTQAKIFEEALREQDVPYRVVGGQAFFDRKEVKDMIAYLKVCLNPHDDNSLRRIINLPSRGLGPILLEHISDFTLLNQCTFWEGIKQIARRPDLIDGMTHHPATKLAEFVQIIEEFHERFTTAEVERSDLAEVGRELVKRIHLEEYIAEQEKSPKIAKRRLENIEDMLAGLHRFSQKSDASLEGYLTKLMLNRNDDQEKQRDEVTLMTLHASKGLEFPGVFMVGVEECLLPHEQSMDDPKGLSEERRLAYVGITRAKRKLCITCCAQRTKFGKKIAREPSRFMHEIPHHLLDKRKACQTSSMQRAQEDRAAKGFAMLRAMGFLDEKKK
jgi:DNA helicase-2/ATP-dependent DNA helicase PcrA